MYGDTVSIGRGTSVNKEKKSMLLGSILVGEGAENNKKT